MSADDEKRTIQLTQDEYDFLRWAVLHHHWSNTMSIVRYTPNEEYTGYHLDENKVLEGLFPKLGISDQEVIAKEAEHYQHPSKRLTRDILLKLNPRFMPTAEPKPQEMPQP